MWNKIQRIYVGTEQVRPYVFKPTANTIAYFPLINDQTDKVWSAYVNVTWTKQNVWFKFTASSSQKLTVANVTQKVYFTSLWGQWNTRATSNDTISFFTKDGGLRFCWYHTSSSSIGTWGGYNSSSTWIGSNYGSRSVPQNTWFHLACGWKNWVYRAYINWSLVWSGSGTPKSYTGDDMGLMSNNWCAWTFSDIIYEKELWTDQQVADYYNLTKSNYWL